MAAVVSNTAELTQPPHKWTETMLCCTDTCLTEYLSACLIEQAAGLLMTRSVTDVCLSFAELPENWTDTRETLLEGMVFQLKYLGVTMVEQPKGEELSAAAVKRIVATVRDNTHLHTLAVGKTHTHSWIS